MVPRCIGYLSECRKGYRNHRGSYGPYWALREREGAAKGWPHPHPHGPSTNWTRGRGGAPSFLLLPLSFLLLLVGLGKGGIQLPLGVGLPPLGAPYRAGRPPPCSFIYGGRGHPRTHKLTIVLAACSSPLHRNTPRSYCRSA